MPKKVVFISFDYDNDRKYRYLLKAFSNNPQNDIEFEDATPEEIQSSDIGRIKAVLTSKIRQATHTLVVIGEHANSYHRDRAEIGERNWQWWEINKSYAEGKKLIGLKIDSSYSSPEPLLGKNASWAYSFNVDAILKAINGA